MDHDALPVSRHTPDGVEFTLPTASQARTLEPVIVGVPIALVILFFEGFRAALGLSAPPIGVADGLLLLAWFTVLWLNTTATLQRPSRWIPALLLDVGVVVVAVWAGALGGLRAALLVVGALFFHVVTRRGLRAALAVAFDDVLAVDGTRLRLGGSRGPSLPLDELAPSLRRTADGTELVLDGERGVDLPGLEPEDLEPVREALEEARQVREEHASRDRADAREAVEALVPRRALAAPLRPVRRRLLVEAVATAGPLVALVLGWPWIPTGPFAVLAVLLGARVALRLWLATVRDPVSADDPLRNDSGR